MVAVVDYRMGNTRSVVKTLQTIGYEAILTNDRQQLKQASHLILPGVGAYKDGMQNLHDLHLVEFLHQEVVGGGKPFLAICLGLQLLGEEGTENGGPFRGLGWIRGRVERFTVDESVHKVPHVGWNNVSLARQSPLFESMSVAEPDFYFVHSYHLKCRDEADVIATCNYGETFVAAIQKQNIMATQFHPEKSQKNGIQLLKNFLALK